MKAIKRITALIVALSVMTVTLSSCAKNSGSDETSISVSTAGTDTETAVTTSQEPLKAIFDVIRDEYNDSLDLSDYPLTPNEIPDGFEAVYEAENADMTGSVKAFSNSSLSGGQGIRGLENASSDTLTFNLELEHTGFYDFNFISKSDDVLTRENFVYVDGEKSGAIHCEDVGKFTDSYFKNVYLEAGTHKIMIEPSWGYIEYDCLKLTKNTSVTEDTYNVTAPLSNPNADDNTKRLYKFLCDIYGKYTLSGQYANEGRLAIEYRRINMETDKQFAVLGLDMMGNDSGSLKYAGATNAVDYAYDWYVNAGGIVTFCWHWRSPAEYQLNSEEYPWHGSFYTDYTTIDLDKIMNGEDEEGYKILMNDIDLIAGQLARLRDAGIPVLWRPLHEAAGGWFWWGNCEAESYIKLWNIMYDKMTNEHNLTNLIWVWNAQNPDWYPGDETVDIVAYDIYAGEQVDTPFSGTFSQLAEVPGENKLVALSENGCVMDPDKVMESNSRWLFWATWYGDFVVKNLMLTEQYTSLETLNKAYQHERVLTLDELPDLKSYPLE